MLRRSLTWSLALLLFAGTVTSAHAADAENKPGFQGRLYADLGAYAAIPRGTMTHDFDGTMTGFSFAFGIGRKGIPATLGIAAHETLMSTNDWRTGASGVFIYDGQTGFGDLYLGRRLDVRGADLVLRLEPEGWWVRPFVELRGGILQLHCTWTLDATVTVGDGPLDEREETGDITWSWGYGAGLRIQVYRSDFGSVGDIVFLVSFGVRAVRAGALRYLEPHTTLVGGQPTYSFSIAQPAFQSLEPFILVGFESRSPSTSP
jgi:hypothetical protein